MMKTLLKVAALSVLLLQVITSCQKEHPAIYQDNYFPMNVGDSWSYKSRKEEVKGLKTFNNTVYFEVQANTYRADTIFYSYKLYYRIMAEGRVYQLDTESNIEFLLFDFTVRVNHSWTSPSGIGSWHVTNATDTMSVTINHTKIARCREFVYDIPEAMDEEHGIILAPGIGRIINVSFAWGLPDTLKSAHINGVDYHFE